MDSHNVGRGRGGVENALKQITARCLVLGLKGDLLFANEEQSELARLIPNASLEIIPSFYGHDGFLIEAKAISQSLKNFLSVVSGQWSVVSDPTLSSFKITDENPGHIGLYPENSGL